MTDANTNHWSHDDDAGEVGSEGIPGQGDAIKDFDEPEDLDAASEEDSESAG